jgi:VWFA-related protein
MSAARLLSLVALTAAAGVGASAQRGAPPDQRPVFRGSTTYVSLDVVVTDGNDRPVTDLRREEFRIVERGRPQKIADFELVSVPPHHRPVDLDAPPPAAADVAANTLTAESSRALAIVVDDTRLQPQDIVPIKRTLRRVLESFAPGDQAAFTFVRRSDLGHDFTGDRHRLMRSVNSLRDALGLKPLGRNVKPDIFDALENVIDTLAAARQARRAIILVNTAGCNPANPTFGDFCRSLIERALRAGVPIYGLHPLGLIDALSEAGAGAFNSPEGRAGLEMQIAENNHSLKILAEATGGRAFVQSNLHAAVDEIFADNGNFYLLGYYPDPVGNDGRFHDVEVTVTRPGLRVRARSGYLAAGGRERVTTPAREMTGRLGAGLPDPSLPLRAFVAPIAAGRRGALAIVTAELTYPEPPGGFGGAFKDEWRLGILGLNSDAKITASFQRPVAFDGTWKSTARGAFVINETIDLPRETVTVRVGVTSRALARTGTVHVPVAIPNFTRRELQVSPIVLGIAGNPLAAVDAAIGHDHIRSLVPFQPTTARTFSMDQSVRVYAKAFWGSDREAPAGEILLSGPTSVAVAAAWRVLPAPPRGGPGHAVLDQVLPLAGLPPGEYVLRVSATLERGEAAAREVPLEIRAAPALAMSPASARLDVASISALRRRPAAPRAEPTRAPAGPRTPTAGG